MKHVSLGVAGALAGFGLLAFGFGLGISAGAADQQKQLSVEWGNSDITSFATSPRAATAPSVLPNDGGRLTKLKLPVLSFERPPQQLTRSLAAGAATAPTRKLIMDEDNPVWYSIVERYGDITVSIEADLRLQKDLPPSAKVYSKLPAADQISSVSILDGGTEPGMEGAIAEYVVYKYPNIPYRVTIECNAKSIDYCRDPKKITQDQEFLKLISARPPQ